MSGDWCYVEDCLTEVKGYVPSSAVSAFTNTVYATGALSGDQVNFRKGPSTKYPSLGKLIKGTEVEIIASSGDWYYVRVKATGSMGFVYKSYVSVGGAVTQSATVNVKILNLRSAPSTSTGKILKTLKQGEKLTVNSVSGDWAYVTYGSTKGYVYKPYITIG